MMGREKYHIGNLFNKGGKVMFAAFADIDDLPNQVALLIDSGYYIFPSRSHALGHAVKVFSCYREWILEEKRIDRVGYYSGRVVRFLCLSETMEHILEQWQMLPILWKSIRENVKPTYQIFDGIPAHLCSAIVDYTREVFGSTKTSDKVLLESLAGFPTELITLNEWKRGRYKFE